MEVAQVVTLVLSTSGGTVIVTEVIKWVRESASGRSARKRVEVDRAQAEKQKAVEAKREAQRALDLEASLRRQYAESLSQHRRIIIEAECLGTAELPPWPE